MQRKNENVIYAMKVRCKKSEIDAGEERANRLVVLAFPLFISTSDRSSQMACEVYHDADSVAFYDT